MNRKPSPANQQRKRNKRNADRPVHVDKYAPTPRTLADRVMDQKLGALADRFNGTEAGHE
jgi:hypothetical protein